MRRSSYRRDAETRTNLLQNPITRAGGLTDTPHLDQRANFFLGVSASLGWVLADQYKRMRYCRLSPAHRPRSGMNIFGKYSRTSGKVRSPVQTSGRSAERLDR